MIVRFHAKFLLFRGILVLPPAMFQNRTGLQYEYLLKLILTSCLLHIEYCVRNIFDGIFSRNRWSQRSESVSQPESCQIFAVVWSRLLPSRQRVLIYFRCSFVTVAAVKCELAK